MVRLRHSFVLGCALAVWFPTSAIAQDNGDAPPLRAVRLDGEAIHLDGRLDEGAWTSAPAASDFTQQEPVEGAEPSRPTAVRILYDEDHLYIGAKIYDDPEEILAFQMRRDAGLGTDDRFMWVLDTFLDGRTGYFFETNAQGLMGDGLITGSGGGGRGGFGGGGRINKAWDGIWEVRTDRQEDGWTAEIRIPFQTLNFDPALDTWGINFQRTIRRTNEEILWRGYRRDEGLFRVIHAGQVTGLRGMSQGVGLEARASAITGWRTVVANEDPTTLPRDLSLDLNYNVTSSLRASLSVNTDFAEVEVDDRRVNLTRFPLRFQERRDFFLEGSGVYSFAPRSGPQPYFSRRIGLEEGEQIPINYGARLGGQVGPFEVGLIQVGTAEADHRDDGISERLPGEQFTVARVRRRILSQSTVGAIYTRRGTASVGDAPAPDDRHTAGVDLNLATTSFLGRSNAEMEAFLVWNSNPDPTVDRDVSELTARGFRFNFPNDIWSGHLSYREFGDEYDPAVGFVRRNDFRRVEPRIGWSPRPESISWLRQMEFSVQYRYLEGLESGIAEEKEWDINLLGMNFESGDNFDIQFKRTYEFLDGGFEVSDGVEIVPGGYTTREISFRGRTASRRTVSADANLSRGGFWNGDRTRIELGMDFRPSPGLSVSGEWEHNAVTLPQGDFTAELFRVSGGWNLSPWVTFNGNVQYDDVSDVVGLFFRGRWTVTPGNDIYIVYTQNWERLGPGADPLDRRFATISRGGSLKANYTYRF